MVTPGAAAPKEDFKAYDVDTPAAPTEAAPPDPSTEDEWSAFAEGGESPAEEPPADAPAAEAEDFGDFDAAPPAAAPSPEPAPAPEEDPWSAFDAIAPPTDGVGERISASARRRRDTTKKEGTET